MKFKDFHDKNYKLLLLIPASLLLLSIIYLGIFYSNNGDIMKKDISLTGGTSITIYGEISPEQIEKDLSSILEELSARKISDLITQEQKAIILETKTSADDARIILEDYFGYKLTSENSSFEFTGSSLSESFYAQLVLAIIVAFSFMGWVVFLIFGKNTKLKILVGFLVFIGALMSFFVLPPNVSIVFSLIVLIISLLIYFIHSIPSLAVIISAFADIIMTLAMVDILGMKMSSAGIVAFLMLIGYSVDTDILLTTRILKRSEGSLNRRMFGAFKTGITMTLTSFLAVFCALLVVKSFSITLTQIFTILSIGLIFDLLNTWITNASLLKWYVEKKK
jgi:preprotein translocase subunit SecF